MPHRSRTSQLLAGVAGAVMLMGAGLLEARAQQQPQPQPAVPSEFSLSEIETFADAAVEVRQVQEDLETRVQAAEDAEEIDQLQQQAQQDAQAAVEDNGLSVDQYNAILQAANQDPQLYAMIVEVIQRKAR
ncbi:MAG TPA: DUF4168 domain-containing protein [Geminicoccaceae bacterium]|jgi:restriction endonuclease Mrr|nr:DUF4168 domain-containing protein [Geminicoccaceae bacterium]